MPVITQLYLYYYYSHRQCIYYYNNYINIFLNITAVEKHIILVQVQKVGVSFFKHSPMSRAMNRSLLVARIN